jgi:hypothetical protein
MQILDRYDYYNGDSCIRRAYTKGYEYISSWASCLGLKINCGIEEVSGEQCTLKTNTKTKLYVNVPFILVNAQPL